MFSIEQFHWNDNRMKLTFKTYNIFCISEQFSFKSSALQMVALKRITGCSLQSDITKLSKLNNEFKKTEYVVAQDCNN